MREKVAEHSDSTITLIVIALPKEVAEVIPLSNGHLGLVLAHFAPLR